MVNVLIAFLRFVDQFRLDPAQTAGDCVKCMNWPWRGFVIDSAKPGNGELAPSPPGRSTIGQLLAAGPGICLFSALAFNYTAPRHRQR
jgi:hypothetical protein